MTIDHSDLEGPASHDRSEFLRRAAGVAVGLSAATAFSASAASAAIDQATASTSASAKMGINLGKKFAGRAVNFQVEAGLQAASWKSVAKPAWEQLTGTTLNIVEVPFTQQFQKLVAASQVSGFVDCAYCAYSWLPDLVRGKVLADFGPLKSKYMRTAALRRELADFEPTAVRAVASWQGRQWGYPIDGPGLTTYYRTDLFKDPNLRTAFRAQYGYDLAPPTTWKQYGEIAAFMTSKLEPNVYGALHAAGAGQAYFWFFQAYNSAEFGGGRYFDSNMKAVINGPGGRNALEALKGFLQSGPPGANTIDPGRVWTDFGAGKLAMNVEFSPFARWYSDQAKNVPSFVPKSNVRGKFALAVPPGGNADVPSGYSTVILQKSQAKDLAFAFLTWATSPDVYSSLVLDSYSLVKPVRKSQFAAANRKPQWPGHAQQFGTLKATLKRLSLEPKWLSAQEYIVAVDQACTAAYTGTSTQKALDDAASKWNAITARVGTGPQRQAYAAYLREMRQLRAV